jgi:hypothetical protein
MNAFPLEGHYFQLSTCFSKAVKTVVIYFLQVAAGPHHPYKAESM